MLSGKYIDPDTGTAFATSEMTSDLWARAALKELHEMEAAESSEYARFAAKRADVYSRLAQAAATEELAATLARTMPV